jgi:hypothetical protein
LPSIARVRVVDDGASVVIVHEVLLPRGEWRGEDLDFYVAYSVPGAPLALDAHLLAVPDGALAPRTDDVGDALSVTPAARRPITAHALVGRSTSAGVVVHVPKASLEARLAPGGMAALRLRARHVRPSLDPDGAFGVVARLGESRGAPLTLGTVSLTSKRPLARVEARLCGDAADPHPLAMIAEVPPPASPPPRDPAAIAPVLAVRRASDDVCIRWWPSR